MPARRTPAEPLELAAGVWRDLVNRDVLLRPAASAPPSCPSTAEELLASTDLGKFAVYVPALGPEAVRSVMCTLMVSAGNLYATLEEYGALLITPARPYGDGIRLGGGSYSTVSLHTTDAGLVVRKRLRVRREHSLDRESRQMQESEWLAALPEAAADLFPVVVGVIDAPDEVGVDTHFAPGYSLGELVFQRRLIGSELATRLADVYSAIRDRLWRVPAVPLRTPLDDGDYPARIERRIGVIAASGHPASWPVRALLDAPAVRVNGVRVPSVRSLLRILREDARWRPIVSPAGRSLAHGDLILENVIVDPRAPVGFRLVDPNPSNRHPALDLAKTMLSLWLQYEFVYFDAFAVELSVSRQTGDMHVDLAIGEPDVQDHYRQAADSFMAFVKAELGTQTGLPRDELEPLLRMGAAMNALAIPSFHLLHHERAQRALAFIALGLLHAQQAIATSRPASQ